MLIVLPPSETKSYGGTGASLELSRLSFPTLNPHRKEIADSLVDLCTSQPEAEAAQTLGLSPNQLEEIAANQQLFNSPTTAALFRYTGVLYDALDASSLTDRARQKLIIGSGLFGLVAANDPIPHYRLSGGTKLAGNTLKSLWGRSITEALESAADNELIIDLRSGTYQQLGKLPSAVAVRVESLQPDGSRKVISHFNKHYKGLLARELARSRADVQDISKLKKILEKAGFTMEFSAKNPQELIMVIDS